MMNDGLRAICDIDLCQTRILPAIIRVWSTNARLGADRMFQLPTEGDRNDSCIVVVERSRHLQAGARARRIREPAGYRVSSARPATERRAACAHRTHARAANAARIAGENAETALDPGSHRGRRRLDFAPGPASGHRAYLRPRHAPRADAREHPWRAVPPHEALRPGDPGPARPALDEADFGTARGKNARRTRAGRDRPGAGEKSPSARAARDRHKALTGTGAARGPDLPARGDRRGADAIGFRAAAAASHAGDGRNHER